ncbi:hypothetical protein [Duganella sp. FT27W]|uniref:hypothetical protein n=1 Tax=Duganella sp. FT27W TaxID=2654636 RepID=UPI00128DFAD6|nr:hypothetical protein [Duganella sp. FT27W]MPQ56081.1 hypothetical protein [Duganella sp. FT27W]
MKSEADEIAARFLVAAQNAGGTPADERGPVPQDIVRLARKISNAAREVCSSRFKHWACAISALALCSVLMAAHAASPVNQASSTPGEVEVVNITGTRDPAMRTYRSVVRGLDAFDEHRHLAPNAALRFRFAHTATVLKPGTVTNKLEAGPAASDVDGLSLRLASDDGSVPRTIDADGRFDILHSQAAYDADATFVLNKKSGLFTYYPDIRSPGLPQNVRRLGHLRLECFVWQAIAREEISLVTKLMLSALFRSSDFCAKRNFRLGMPAYGQLARVTIWNGAGRGEFSFDGTTYSVPIGPSAFSDDALITLEYVSQGNSPSRAPQQTEDPFFDNGSHFSEHLSNAG